MSGVKLKYAFAVVLIIFSLCVSLGRCQDEDEDDEDTYDEELADNDSTTTRRSRVRNTSIAPNVASSDVVGGNSSGADSASTLKAIPEETAAATVATAPAAPAVAPAPVPAAPVTRPPPVTAATTISEYDEENEPTEEEGYGYIFRPLNSLVDNIVAGNVTGIVDHALSIRTPPEIRAFVNNVMQNVFGSGIGSALKQFMPNIFSTKSPATLSPGRDPIPTQQPRRRAARPRPGLIPRTNTSDEGTVVEAKPMEIPFIGHPGAPASRLRCEIIA